MPLPSDLTTITVTGTYQSITGAPLTGQVNFSITTPVQDSTGKVILGVGTQIATLGASGSFNIVLPCTDNADLNPTGFSYLVTEVISGLGRAYYIQLPHTLGSTVDLSAVAPASPPPPTSAFNTANTWTATQTFSANPGLKITAGAASGDVLTSDASGNATWQPAQAGFTNPMTTLGDTLYENATPAAARLPGNITTTRNFLTQTGTGTVSAAPSWGTIAPADLSAAFPWQFYVDNPAYGAKGNGKIIGDATVALGQLSTLTSASANFTSADTGKFIMLNGGQGNNAQPLITTITFVNSTTVTLAHAASGAVTNASAVYGTDDTAAIQSAVTAAGAYAMAAGGPFHAQVIFGNKIYCLATPPPVTSGVAGSTTSQIRIPSPASSGATQKLILDLIGVGNADTNMYWEATVPDIQGSCLVSMCIPPFTSGTNPFPSVVGYQYALDGSLVGGFANTKVYVDGITAVIPYLGPQGGWDFRFLGGAGGGTFSAMSFGAPVNGNYNNLANLNNLAGQQGGSSVGLFMPLTGNNDDCQVFSFSNQGFTFGVNITEHCAFHRLSSVYDIVGIQCVGGGAHGNWIGYASVEAAFAAVQYTGTNPYPLVINILDTETVTTWHVQDTQNSLFGSVLVHTNSGAPAVLGGVNLKITSDLHGPGHWSSPPSVPGSTSAQQNTAWRDAFIVLHTGVGVTVSAISIDGTVTGLSMAASSSLALPLLPAGKNITLTYSGGTPTWDWWLA